MIYILGGIFYIIIVVLIGRWAESLNRNGFIWAILSIFITPLFAALGLLLLGRKRLY